MNSSHSSPYNVSVRYTVYVVVPSSNSRLQPCAFLHSPPWCFTLHADYEHPPLSRRNSHAARRKFGCLSRARHFDYFRHHFVEYIRLVRYSSRQDLTAEQMNTCITIFVAITAPKGLGPASAFCLQYLQTSLRGGLVGPAAVCSVLLRREVS